MFVILIRQAKKRFVLAAWKSMRLLPSCLMLLDIMKQSIVTALTTTCLLNQWPCLSTIFLANRTASLDRLYILNARLRLPAAANRFDHNLSSDTGADRFTMNARSTSNPYGLPAGCEYFVATVAMLPDTTIHSPSTS